MDIIWCFAALGLIEILLVLLWKWPDDDDPPDLPYAF